MANLLNGNSFFADTQYSVTTDDLVRASVQVTYITVTAVAANTVLKLGDVQAAAQPKIELRVATAGTTQIFDFSRKPILFPNGIRVLTLTATSNATCVITNVGG